MTTINSDEILFKQAEEIFFELASENLNEASLEMISLNIASLEMEIQEDFDESWKDLIYEQPDQEEFIEVKFFLGGSARNDLVAIMLLSCNPNDEKECHIQWFDI